MSLPRVRGADGAAGRTGVPQPCLCQGPFRTRRRLLPAPSEVPSLARQPPVLPKPRLPARDLSRRLGGVLGRWLQSEAGRRPSGVTGAAAVLPGSTARAPAGKEPEPNPELAPTPYSGGLSSLPAHSSSFWVSFLSQRRASLTTVGATEPQKEQGAQPSLSATLLFLCACPMLPVADGTVPDPHPRGLCQLLQPTLIGLFLAARACRSWVSSCFSCWT